MRLLIALVTILLSLNALAYQLVYIKTMDADKKTFIIRKGKKDGIIVGKKSTFMANNVSFIAKAIQTSREFSQWRLVNSKVSLPFDRKDIITFYDTTEYIWTLTPEENRQKYLKRNLAPKLMNAITMYAGFSRGMNQSFDEVPTQEIERGGYHFEVFYDSELTYDWVLSGGLRFSQELQNFTGASFRVVRMILMGEITYFFKPIKELGMTRFHITSGVGWGQSATKSSLIQQSGYATVLPSMKLGFEVPYEKYRFMSNITLESISAREERAGGSVQTYQTTDAKFLFGLKFFL